ncbi:hypothetical protein Ddye_005135 [Dipteronia dyeriana]|uniref:Uncharacterized protein n=1 Tax=Dipteronia dyeriana TaxID=168575 RepID=A0AAE0CPF1_9ROSI|nr:hypothetical protein Ddye_005135 [Dipteronia dyeriana]
MEDSDGTTIGGSLELAQKHGPCSELKHGKTKTPSWSEILRKEQARIHSINSRRLYLNSSDGNQFEQTNSATTLSFDYDLSIGGSKFYAKVDIGTPGQSK